jgi:ABC-type bacteriocin/lantibiotic exporter with double-glycine peptidase domain
VTFRYVATQRPVLEELSLRIEPGELVALAGHSGCGKSTIIRILLGFERPEQGSVLFDDKDLSSLDVEAVRRQMGVVLQDGQLLPGTVGDNISGVASLSVAEQWELAEVVALADDIRAMPMRLDTPVMLNGGAFSGGQRQRLCIARALAARPRILLLDEATSALDNITQRVITDNLAQLGMTRVLVAHRLSTMVGADRILVLEGGRLVEQGTYDQLMASRGRFFTLAERQVL